MRTAHLVFPFLLLSLLTFSPLTQAQTWQMGPTTPYAPDKILASNDGEILLTGKGTTSVWISRDSGSNWECLDQAIKAVNNQDYYRIVPTMVNDSTYVFVCLGTGMHSSDNNIIVSFDYGVTFVDRSPGSWAYNINYQSLTIHSSDENSWMIKCDGLLFFTENAGLNWFVDTISSDSYEPINTNGIFRDPIDVDTYYFLTQYYFYDLEPRERYTKIYRTTEGPDEWITDEPFIDTNEEFNNPYTSITQFLPLSNGNFISRVSVYPDEDGSWENEQLVTFDSHGDLLFRSGRDINVVLFYFEDQLTPGRIYARAENTRFIHVSNDYGLTWEEMQTEGLPEIEYFQFITLSQSHDGSTIYLSLDDLGLFKSSNHGETWQHVDTFEWPAFYNVYPYSENLYYSDFDASWYRQQSQDDPIIPFNVETSVDSSYKHNELIYVNADTILGVVRVDPISDHNGNRLYRTFDGGSNWEMILDLHNHYINHSYDVEHDQLTLLYKSDDVYHHSIDYGTSWESFSNPQEEIGGFNVQLYRYSQNRLIATGQEDLRSETDVFMKYLGDEEWVDINLPDSSASSPRIIQTQNSIYCMGWDRKFYQYTPQLGWETLCEIPESINIPQFYFRLICSNPYGFIGFNWDATDIILSCDGGYNWRQLEIYLPGGITPNQIGNIKQDPVRNRIWIESSHGIYWYPLEDLLSTTEKSIELIPAEPKLLTNYPNPFNASTSIQYNLTQPGNVKLDVYDITGRLVKTLENTYKPAGLQSVFLDGSGLASGTYFIRLNTETEVRNRKIILVK